MTDTSQFERPEWGAFQWTDSELDGMVRLSEVKLQHETDEERQRKQEALEDMAERLEAEEEMEAAEEALSAAVASIAACSGTPRTDGNSIPVTAEEDEYFAERLAPGELFVSFDGESELADNEQHEVRTFDGRVVQVDLQSASETDHSAVVATGVQELSDLVDEIREVADDEHDFDMPELLVMLADTALALRNKI